MEFLKIDKKIKKIWLITTTIVFVIFLGLCVLSNVIDGIILPLLIVEIIAMLIIGFFCFAFPFMVFFTS